MAKRLKGELVADPLDDDDFEVIKTKVIRRYTFTRNEVKRIGKELLTLQRERDKLLQLLQGFGVSPAAITDQGRLDTSKNNDDDDDEEEEEE